MFSPQTSLCFLAFYWAVILTIVLQFQSYPRFTSEIKMRNGMCAVGRQLPVVCYVCYLPEIGNKQRQQSETNKNKPQIPFQWHLSISPLCLAAFVFSCFREIFWKLLIILHFNFFHIIPGKDFFFPHQETKREFPVTENYSLVNYSQTFPVVL